MSSARVHLGLLTACVAFVSGLACAADGQSPTAVSPEIARKLNVIVAHAALDGSRPGGMIVRVHSLKDNRVWEGAAGAFDGATEVPIKPTVPFRTASIAKSYVAGVIWRLVEDGKLGLDDLISKYLDPSLVSRIHVLNGVSYGNALQFVNCSVTAAVFMTLLPEPRIRASADSRWLTSPERLICR